MSEIQTALALLPCPFCSSRETGMLLLPDSDMHCVSCVDCGAEGPVHESKSQAIAAWNARAQERPASESKIGWCGDRSGTPFGPSDAGPEDERPASESEREPFCYIYEDDIRALHKKGRAFVYQQEQKFVFLSNPGFRVLYDSAPAQAVPEEPSPGLLMSIALRLDHGLGCPDYYDQWGQPGNHVRRLKMALSDACRAWEEVTGRGFYRPEKEAEYAAMLAAAQQPGEKS